MQCAVIDLKLFRLPFLHGIVAAFEAVVCKDSRSNQPSKNKLSPIAVVKYQTNA